MFSQVVFVQVTLKPRSEAILPALDSSSLGGFFDELLQPLDPCFFFLRAHHPPKSEFSIRGRLSVKEFPRRVVLPEPLVVRRGELSAPLFVGIDSRLILFPRLKRLEPRGLHESILAQFLDPFDVDGAPGTTPPARGKADCIADVIHPL